MAKHVLTYNEIENIFKLKEQNKNNSEIARELNIHRQTIRTYLDKGFEKSVIGVTNGEFNSYVNFTESQKIYYAYLLGLYLGDGYINVMPHRKDLYNMRIYCHSDQTEIQNMCAISLKSIYPKNKISIWKQPYANCTEVGCYSKKHPDFFPQHGAGHKHDRLIELTEWQRDILKDHSQYFITGLFDSDGCQYIQTGTNTMYYQFTNRSQDILNLFLDYAKENNVIGVLTHKGDGNYNIFIRKPEDRNNFRKLIDDSWEMLDRISK